jgi:hypothetical protein
MILFVKPLKGLFALVHQEIPLTSLNASGCKVSDASVVRIIQSAGSRLKSIKLNTVHGITKKSLEALAEATMKNGSLQSFNFGTCMGLNTDASSLLCTVVKNSSETLKKINVTGLTCLNDTFVDYLINYTPNLSQIKISGITATKDKLAELEEVCTFCCFIYCFQLKPKAITDSSEANVWLEPDADSIHDNTTVQVHWRTSPQNAQEGAWIGIYTPTQDSINL